MSTNGAVGGGAAAAAAAAAAAIANATKALAFFTKSKSPMDLPANTETVMADKIWIPG